LFSPRLGLAAVILLLEKAANIKSNHAKTCGFIMVTIFVQPDMECLLSSVVIINSRQVRFQGSPENAPDQALGVDQNLSCRMDSPKDL